MGRYVVSESHHGEYKKYPQGVVKMLLAMVAEMHPTITFHGEEFEFYIENGEWVISHENFDIKFGVRIEVKEVVKTK